jgi:hypothetical protein
LVAALTVTAVVLMMIGSPEAADFTAGGLGIASCSAWTSARRDPGKPGAKNSGFWDFYPALGMRVVTGVTILWAGQMPMAFEWTTTVRPIRAKRSSMPAKRSIGRIHTERARPICCSAAPASAGTARRHRMPSNNRRHVTRNHAFVPAHMRSLAGPPVGRLFCPQRISRTR